MKVSVIATVLNEAGPIQPFLVSLLNQTRKPDEIVIVDGGSTDGTVEQVRTFQLTHPFVKLLVEDNCNVARGRNIAITHAAYDYLAITDAGCRVDEHWLAELMKPFEESSDVDVVGGKTEMDPRTPFERWVGYLNMPFEKLDLQSYLPTARSLALRKRCWEAVGGFPEELTMWAEDAVFMLRLKANNIHLVITPSAVVYWRPRRNLKEFCQQYFEYGIGDGEAAIHTTLFLKRFGLFLSTFLLVAGWWINIVLPLISAVYLFVAFLRLMPPLKTTSLSWWKLIPLFVLTLVKESSQLFGYCVGRMRRR